MKYKGLTWVRHLAEGNDLIQEDPKGPHVWFDGELVAVDGLRGRPLHREFGPFSGHVKVLVLRLRQR